MDRFMNFKPGDRRMAVKFDTVEEYKEFCATLIANGFNEPCYFGRNDHEIENLIGINRNYSGCIANGCIPQSPKSLYNCPESFYDAKPNCDVYNYKDLNHGKRLTFKTEKELLDYANENMIAVEASNDVEWSCLCEMMYRNGFTLHTGEHPGKEQGFTKKDKTLCIDFYYKADWNHANYSNCKDKVTYGHRKFYEGYKFKVITFEELYDMLE